MHPITLRNKVLFKYRKMYEQKQHLESLSEIRSLMERSSRFISLSGLSGIIAGIIALFGAAAAYWYFDYNIYYPKYYSNIFDNAGNIKTEFLAFLFTDAFIVLSLALAFGIFFTTRQAKKKGQQIWDNIAKRLLLNLLIPLATGGVFCLILLYHGEVYLVAPATLIFYGLALLNASKYTLNDIRYLGITEIVLGLISSVFAGYGLLFWAIGFGILHIIYGTVMYYKYEK